MDCLTLYETDIFILLLQNKEYNCKKYWLIKDKIQEISNLFGFDILPKELKLRIYIVDNEYMNAYIKKHGLNIPKNSIAFSTLGNEIYVTYYNSIINTVKEDDYIKILLHECIHILQMYFSKKSPQKYIWLYESIACYIANQFIDYIPNTIVTWDFFVNHFYCIENCYGLAYKYGSALFNYSTKQDVLKLLKYPDENIEIFERIYKKLFKLILEQYGF
jgi:hypothetical protein